MIFNSYNFYKFSQRFHIFSTESSLLCNSNCRPNSLNSLYCFTPKLSLSKTSFNSNNNFRRTQNIYPSLGSLFLDRHYFKLNDGQIKYTATNKNVNFSQPSSAIPSVELIKGLNNTIFNNPQIWGKSSNENSNLPEKLYVRVHGHGPQIVLMLHDLGHDGTYWEPVISHMDHEKYTFICPDLLAHGKSLCADHLDYTPYLHLHYIQNDVIEKIASENSSDDCGLYCPGYVKEQKSFHLVGSGFGALLAIELALIMHKRIQSLNLVSLSYSYHNTALKKFFGNKEYIHLYFIISLLCLFSDIPFLGPINRYIKRLSLYLPERLHAIVSSYYECIKNNRIDEGLSHLNSLNLGLSIIEGNSYESRVLCKKFQELYPKIIKMKKINCDKDIVEKRPRNVSQALEEEF